MSKIGTLGKNGLRSGIFTTLLLGGALLESSLRIRRYAINAFMSILPKVNLTIKKVKNPKQNKLY